MVRIPIVTMLIAGSVSLVDAPAPAAEPDLPPSLVAPTEPLSPDEQLSRFHLPPGFSIQLVACEPAINKPMNLAFDGRGRLFVTSSREYPYPAADDAPRRDKLVVMEDADFDGRADSILDLRDGLNIPIGVTPYRDGLIYYSIPRIRRCRDVDHDGQMESDEPLYGDFGFRDTHGMASSFTRWVDGWIYVCHGFLNTSTVKAADGASIEMNSGNTFRIKPDGSHIERVTHGQVNPFGLCFDPLGNLFSADCHTMPVYQLLRGAWYPSFGKPHDGMGFGPTMIGHDHGSTGIAGVVYYAADHFPSEYHDTVFIGNPVTGRINHDRLEVHGSTFKAVEQPDFLTCDDPWFRPVDIKLGPDGALYIADFYNCIIGHYEVPLTHPRRDRDRGRIWRVVYTGPDGQAESPRPLADLSQRTTDELIDLLGDPNLTVRVLAAEELRSPAPELVARRLTLLADQLLAEDGEPGSNPVRRAHALWLYELLARDGLDDSLVQKLAADPDRLVRVHLVKALAERSAWIDSSLDVATLVRGRLVDADAFVRRAAADALGRHPDPANIEPLLGAWQSAPADDTHLVHVIRMALRDQLLAPGAYERAAQLAGDGKAAELLADVSLGVRSAASAEFLLTYIQARPAGDGPLPLYLHDVVRYASEDRLTSAVDFARQCGTEQTDPLRRRDLVLAVGRVLERGAAVPEEVAAWGLGVARELLAGAEQGQVHGGIELAREFRLRDVRDELMQLAGAQARFAELRGPAIDACVAVDAPSAVELLAGIIGEGNEPLPLRQKAVAALAGVGQADARDKLLELLRFAPDRLAVDIAAGLAQRTEGAEQLLARIAEGKASPRLLQEPQVRERLKAAKVPDVDAQLDKLTADLPPADERILKLIAARREGYLAAQADLQLGQSEGQKMFHKTCAACHRLAGQGNKIGPDLEGVGIRGLDRLLEDLLDPSRNVDQAFRSTLINTVDGRTIAGLLLREEGQVLILADDKGKEIRLPLADVEERTISPLSPMPGNVAELITPDEFNQLIAYILSQRAKNAP